MVANRQKSKQTRNMMRQYSLVAAMAAMALGPAMADEFYLATGKVVRGALVSRTDSEYIIQTEIGTIRLNRSDVTRTVDHGTTPVEIEGDIALKNGNLVNARASYTQALNQAVAGSVAAQRVQEKLNRLASASQQAAVGALVDQYNRALGLVEARQYEAAEKILTELAPRIASDDPLSSEILKMQAQIHYGKGMAAFDAVKLETATQELEAAIAADPSFYPAYLSLGESLLENSATVLRGMELLEQGISVAGDRISEQQKYAYQYRLAKKYFDQKQYAKAAATYAALIPARDKYPAYADALDLAVESYVRVGEESLSSDFRETIANLNTALKLNPANQKALFLLGRIYLDLGQIENAVVSLKRLVDLNPNYEEANHYLGRAYFQANDNESALQYLGVEISNAPDNYFALVDRAEVYIEEANNSAAQADLAAAQLLDPSHWRAYYLLGLLEFNREDYQQAQKSLMEALDKNKSAVPAHLLMSRVLIAQDQLPGARKWLDQVVNRLEGAENLSYIFKTYKADALTQLGEIALKENSPRQAENYLATALQTLPDYVRAMAAMAETKLLLARDAYLAASKEQLYNEAEALYLEAIRKDPNTAEYYSELGRFYQVTRNDNQQAIKYYNLYADNGGTDSRVNVWLQEAGGTARPELAVSTVVTAGATTGTMSTTATMAMTTGPMGTMTATTATAISAPAGVVLPVDAMMAEAPTTGTMTVTTTTATSVNPAPGAPAPQPGAGQPGQGIPAFPGVPPAQ